MESDAPRATGSCLCGGVRFEIRGPLRDIINCHCSQCRRTQGVGAFSAAARRDLTFRANSSLRWFRSSDRAQRGFCGVCGASLFWAADGSPRVSIAAGALDQPTGLKVLGHIYVDDLADYAHLGDSLPTFPQGSGGALDGDNSF